MNHLRTDNYAKPVIMRLISTIRLRRCGEVPVRILSTSHTRALSRSSVNVCSSTVAAQTQQEERHLSEINKAELYAKSLEL